MKIKILVLAIMLPVQVCAQRLPSNERNMEMAKGIMNQIRAVQKLPPSRREAERKRLVNSFAGVSKVQAEILYAEAVAARLTLRGLIDEDPALLRSLRKSDKLGQQFAEKYDALAEAFQKNIRLLEDSAVRFQQIADECRRWAGQGKGAVALNGIDGKKEVTGRSATRVKNLWSGIDAGNKPGAEYITVRYGQTALILAARHKISYSRFLALNPAIRKNPDRVLANSRVKVK